MAARYAGAGEPATAIRAREFARKETLLPTRYASSAYFLMVGGDALQIMHGSHASILPTTKVDKRLYPT